MQSGTPRHARIFDKMDIINIITNTYSCSIKAVDTRYGNIIYSTGFHCARLQQKPVISPKFSTAASLMKTFGVNLTFLRSGILTFKIPWNDLSESRSWRSIHGARSRSRVDRASFLQEVEYTRPKSGSFRQRYCSRLAALTSSLRFADNARYGRPGYNWAAKKSCLLEPPPAVGVRLR